MEDKNLMPRHYDLYIPKHLSEVQDVLASMVGGAPKFIKDESYGLGRNLESEFKNAADGLAAVRDKLGDARYERLMALLGQAKALFLADQNDDNGKTKQGCDLLWEMDAIIEEVREERYAAGLPDVDGEVTGD